MNCPSLFPSRSDLQAFEFVRHQQLCGSSKIQSSTHSADPPLRSQARHSCQQLCSVVHLSLTSVTVIPEARPKSCHGPNSTSPAGATGRRHLWLQSLFRGGKSERPVWYVVWPLEPGEGDHPWHPLLPIQLQHKGRPSP